MRNAVESWRSFSSFALLAPALAGASLDGLVNASAALSAAILQQLVTVQGAPSAAELAEKTIAYAGAKTAYYEALRAAAPEGKAGSRGGQRNG
jgi:hypothetical protein